MDHPAIVRMMVPGILFGGLVFRFIALLFVGIIIYRLASVFVFNRQVRARQNRDSDGSAQPAEFEIIDDRPPPSSASETESSTREPK